MKMMNANFAYQAFTYLRTFFREISSLELIPLDTISIIASNDALNTPNFKILA